MRTLISWFQYWPVNLQNIPKYIWNMLGCVLIPQKSKKHLIHPIAYFLPFSQGTEIKAYLNWNLFIPY